MLIEQSASDQSKIAGQQTQWLAYIDTDTGGDHRLPRPFTWRGFAHSESDAIAKAIKSSELTLRAFDALDHRPSAGAAPTPLAALRIVALPAERSGSNDLSHALSVAGAPFIQPSGAEEQFCLAATRPTFKPDGVDYTITHQITRMTMWLLTLDPLVRRILAQDQKLTVRWTANVDMLRQPNGDETPHREIGFSIRDKNGSAVAVHEATANAILILMLATRGTRANWATFRPVTLYRTYIGELIDLCPEKWKRKQKRKSVRLLANPSRRLGKVLMNLLMSGQTELAAHVAAMADPTEP